MSWSNFRLLLTLVFINLSVGLAICPSLTAQSQRLENPNSNTTLTPPKEDAPDDTAGGSSRDGAYCKQDSRAEGSRGFSVAMPAYTETNAERPTFSLYIPKTAAKKIFFSLKDAEEKYYYQTTIILPEKSGELKFQLPTDAPPLATRKEYTWSFGLVCQDVFDPNDPIKTGVIKRVGQNQITGNMKY
jgi:hypothetical protein